MNLVSVVSLRVVELNRLVTAIRCVVVLADPLGFLAVFNTYKDREPLVAAKTMDFMMAMALLAPYLAS